MNAPSATSNTGNLVHRYDNIQKLALLFIATGAIFGIYGSGVGSLMLAYLSGIKFPFPGVAFSPHPYAQIYGFVFEFIMGVAYILIPRFKGKKLRAGHLAAAYSSYLLVTSADAGFLILGYVTSAILSELSSLLFLLGVCIFTFHTLLLAFKQGGGFPETNPLIAEASIASLLSAIILVFATYPGSPFQVDIFSEPAILLNLLGFASSMIYAVEIRSVSFRQSDYRSGAANLTWLTQGIAILLCFASMVLSSQLLLLFSVVLFLMAAVSASISLKLFGMSHPLMNRPSMTNIHYKIMSYNDMAMIPSFTWLFLALILGILMASEHTGKIFLTSELSTALYAVGSSTYTRDIFIHAIAIGFIGLAIICYAPMLLPGLLGRRGPTTGLSYYPIAILNVAMLLRVAGDAVAIMHSNMPGWEALSGPLVLLAIALFLFMIHSVGKGRVEITQRPNPAPTLDENLLKTVAEIKIRALDSAGKTHTHALWFAYADSRFYLLPSQDKTGNLIEVLKQSPNVSIELQRKSFGAIGEITTDRKIVKKVGKLFKDKYGQRNFRNIFGEAENQAVLVLGQLKEELQERQG